MAATLATRMKAIQEYLGQRADYLLKFSTPKSSRERLHLPGPDLIDRIPRLATSEAHIKDWLHDQIQENVAYAHEYGVDKPDIRDWKWPYS